MLQSHLRCSKNIYTAQLKTNSPYYTNRCKRAHETNRARFIYNRMDEKQNVLAVAIDNHKTSDAYEKPVLGMDVHGEIKRLNSTGLHGNKVVL